ncbi:MAG: GxxExxY protein [Ignavibacteria bacterium]|nr:GxxExxY protein [Ignavibacteria bacterium]
MGTLIHEELSNRIIGCFYQVYNTLGHGFLEKVYENSLLIELRKQGLQAEQQIRRDVFYDGLRVGEYFADIVVDDRVIIELKAADGIAPEHEG